MTHLWEKLRRAVVEPAASFRRGIPSLAALARSRRHEVDTLHGILPSNATSGEDLTLTLQVWDGYERLVPGFEGTVRLASTDPEATVPDRVRFHPDDDGLRRVEGIRFETPGVQYLILNLDGDQVLSNPVAVSETDPGERVYWGDIHLHSQFSDGAGSMRTGFEFGRDVMALDVVAYTDHDTMGFFIPPTLQRWLMRHHNLSRMKRVTESFNDPGEFVTLYGYEWTKQPDAGGHINVYFDGIDGAPFYDSRHPESDTYEKLWARLREWRDARQTDTDSSERDGTVETPDGKPGDPRPVTDVVTIPHHPAEAMYPFDFAATAYDDELAPLVEIYSQWGSSEEPAEAGNRKPIGGIGKGEIGTRGHYARDALALGHRVGFVAGSDYHGPRPGHSILHVDPHLPSLREFYRDGLGWGTVWRIWDEDSYPGGLTAFRAPSLTRKAIFGSLRDCRVYGTTQPDRILVSFAVGGVAVEDATRVLSVPEATASREVTGRVAGTGPLEAVEVVKNTETWRTVTTAEAGPEGFENYVSEFSFVDEAPIEGVSYDEQRGTDDDMYHLRVSQENGGMAWAGPIWVTVDGGP